MLTFFMSQEIRNVLTDYLNSVNAKIKQSVVNVWNYFQPIQPMYAYIVESSYVYRGLHTIVKKINSLKVTR